MQAWSERPTTLVLIDGAFYLARTLAILSVLHSFRA